MENILDDLSFDDWIRYVFDHPVDDSMPHWYWQADRDYWDAAAEPTVTINYLISLFENSVANLTPYSDAQINQGLWYVVSNACSTHMLTLTDKRVSQEERRDCIHAIYTLFKELFQPRCSANLQYLDEHTQGDPNPLDSICYMWWDVIPLYGASAGGNADTIINIMADILQLNSDACRESALHGLGHWYPYAPKRIERIITNFLKQAKHARPELITYAQWARKGVVQ